MSVRSEQVTTIQVNRNAQVALCQRHYDTYRLYIKLSCNYVNSSKQQHVNNNNTWTVQTLETNDL